MKQRLTLFIATMLLSIGAAMAQITVKGTVISADDGEPLPGASVKIVGEKKGTVTNADGHFTITVPNEKARLEFSHIGMMPRVIKARNGMQIALDTDETKLDEVMVVAYGTAKKSAFTGSATVVGSETLEKLQVTNAAEALKGKVTGVQVTQSSGQPGEAPQIRIRGITSYSSASGNDPLWVVDGAPFDGDINTIAPTDIESMTVLKEAAAAALYGARGANGVIIITTKSGKNTGEAQITVDAKWGSSSRQLPNYEYINNPAGYYEQYYKGLYNYAMNKYNYSASEANKWANSNMINSPTYGLGYNVFNVPAGQNLIGSNGKLNPYATLGNVVTSSVNGEDYLLLPDDWSDAVYQNALRQEYTVTASASNDRGSFYLSGSYLNQDGITRASAYERFTSRLRAEYRLKPWLNVGANANYAHYNSDNVDNEGSTNDGSMLAMMRMAPIYPLYIRDAQGNVLWHQEAGIEMYDYGAGEQHGLTRPTYYNSNPLSDNLVNMNHLEGNTFSGTVSADITFLKDFRFSSNNTIYVDEYRRQYVENPWFGQYKDTKGHVFVNHGRKYYTNFQQLLNWHHLFAEKHDIEIMVGHEYYSTRTTALRADRKVTFDPHIGELANAVVAGEDHTSYTTKYNTEGFFGRALYNYMERYFGEASFRYDATSRFQAEPKDNRWGKFWSVSGGWLLNKESWFKKLEANWVDEIKLKASYGEQGNDQIPDYLFITTYNFGNSNGSLSLQPGTLGNPNITWETCGEVNVGLEFSLWHGRLSGGIEYYNRITRDMLTSISLPGSFGYTGLFDNVGRMRNQGIEVELNGDIIRTKDLVWSANVNFTTNNNKITKILDENKRLTVEGIEGYSSRSYFYGEGKPMYTYYMYKYAGVNNVGEALYYKDVYQKDAAGNNVLDEKGNPIVESVTTTNTTADATQYLVGEAMAKAFGGFGTSLTWKGLDVSIDFAYQIGGLVYDGTYAAAMNPKSRGMAIHVDALNAWTPTNTSSDIPRWQYNDNYATATSDRFLTNASYLNIQNITIGYTLPKNIVRKAHLGNVRVYAVADNVWLWSHRQGLDPRQTLSGGGASDLNYSPIRTISGGVSITF